MCWFWIEYFNTTLDHECYLTVNVSEWFRLIHNTIMIIESCNNLAVSVISYDNSIAQSWWIGGAFGNCASRKKGTAIGWIRAKGWKGREERVNVNVVGISGTRLSALCALPFNCIHWGFYATAVSTLAFFQFRLVSVSVCYCLELTEVKSVTSEEGITYFCRIRSM